MVPSTIDVYGSVAEFVSRFRNFLNRRQIRKAKVLNWLFWRAKRRIPIREWVSRVGRNSVFGESESQSCEHGNHGDHNAHVDFSRTRAI
jgi:hypothetical protein